MIPRFQAPDPTKKRKIQAEDDFQRLAPKNQLLANPKTQTD